ncbi:MAG: DUF4838 domain-containing protein [Bacteroidaceae bacterium]|nr:DUF4838 domain-containing protein [Bacteroidaceae bacterium]
MKKLLNKLAIITLATLFCNCSQAQVDGEYGLFEYREIYLPEGIKEAKQLGLNNVNEDWGIWGHNLSKVLPKETSMSIYAAANGTRTKEQFCFSSEQLFNYLEEYIDENYSGSKTQRFAILPNDNSLVCQCDQCKKAGNTASDASPAVFKFITRLAERFPNHLFFTSHYLSTRSLPKDSLPENTGVLVSAIDFPLTTISTPQEKEFEALLNAWKQHVNHLYVWDYIQNFDDYFTPFPIFDVMQHRIWFYAQNGVNGIFLNGSGEDFSSMSRLKTYVLADLLKNPTQDMKLLIRDYCHELFPVTGDEIASYIFLLEATTAKRGKPLPMYEGVEKIMQQYFLPEEFSPFHIRLLEQIHQVSGEEREALALMVQAMCLTRLEIKRVNKHIHNGTANLLSLLNDLENNGIHSYSESYWSIQDYIREYREMIDHDLNFGDKNLLKGKQLVPLTPLDDDYNDISILTDGQLGLPSNYHCGQMISSANPALRISIPQVKGMKTLRVSFTKNAIFRIALPRRVVLSVDGVQIASVIPLPAANAPNRSVVEFKIPASASGNLTLTIVRNTDVKTMALDEIEAF